MLLTHLIFTASAGPWDFLFPVPAGSALGGHVGGCGSEEQDCYALQQEQLMACDAAFALAQINDESFGGNGACTQLFVPGACAIVGGCALMAGAMVCDIDCGVAANYILFDVLDYISPEDILEALGIKDKEDEGTPGGDTDKDDGTDKDGKCNNE